MNQKTFDKILEIGIQLSAERDYDKLFTKIINCAMELTNCDAATLYLYENDVLNFCIMKNKTLNIEQLLKDEETYPAVLMREENICAYSAIHKKMLNISDAYESTDFNFSGPKKYDKLTKYRTKSILVAPLINNEDMLVGVLQLINALDKDGNVIPFDKDFEVTLCSLASQMAIALSNMNYVKEIENIMLSITRCFTDVIDKRTPYNFYHSRNVYLYTELFVNYCNKLYKDGKSNRFFNTENKKELLLAALMHDIGKLVIPKDIMNKSTRLGNKLDLVLQRFDYLVALYEIDLLSNKISKDVAVTEQEYLKSSKEKIIDLNKASFLDKDNAKFLEGISDRCYVKADGEKIAYLNSDELECLSVARGNLTEKERNIINSHAAYTEKYLESMKFKTRYSHISKWAGAHHEFLDGTGYPKGLKGDEIPFESRILTVVDIYEALTSNDRPYKKALKEDTAFGVLHEMADNGKIDKYILNIFEEAIRVDGDKVKLKTFGSNKEV